MNCSSGSRCFISVYGQSSGPNYGMITCFFDGVNNISYPSLTQIACSGSGSQLLVNLSSASTGGTQTIFLQLGGTVDPGRQWIQVKTASAFTVKWYIAFL